MVVGHVDDAFVPFGVAHVRKSNSCMQISQMMHANTQKRRTEKKPNKEGSQTSVAGGALHDGATRLDES